MLCWGTHAVSIRVRMMSGILTKEMEAIWYLGWDHRVYKIYKVELQWLDNDVRFCIYQKQINPNKLECVKLIKTLMTCLPLQDMECAFKGLYANKNIFRTIT